MKLLLWETRYRAGISLEELSAGAGISKSALNNYENGRRMPRIDQVEAIARALGVKMTELFESEYK